MQSIAESVVVNYLKLKIMRCVKCNREIPDDSKYCEHCGNKISRKISDDLREILIIVGVSVLLLLIIVVF